MFGRQACRYGEGLGYGSFRECIGTGFAFCVPKCVELFTFQHRPGRCSSFFLMVSSTFTFIIITFTQGKSQFGKKSCSCMHHFHHHSYHHSCHSHHFLGFLRGIPQIPMFFFGEGIPEWFAMVPGINLAKVFVKETLGFPLTAPRSR